MRPQCRQQPGSHANHHREEQRIQSQLGGGRKAGRDQLVDAAPGILERWTEVTLRQVAEVSAVLRQQRLVYLSRSEMNDLVGWGKRLIHQPELLEARISELLAGRRCDTVVTSHENTLGAPFKPGAAHLYPRGPELVTASLDQTKQIDEIAAIFWETKGGKPDWMTK